MFSRQSSLLAVSSLLDLSSYCPYHPINFVSVNPSQTFVDIDECSVDTDVCGYGQCVNRPGSFVCECDIGYSVRQGETACTGTATTLHQINDPYIKSMIL